MQYSNVFGDEDQTPATIPEPEKKGHSQMNYMNNHAIHRKPGTLLPPEDEDYGNQEHEMAHTRLEMKTTLRPVSQVL